jgi:thioredoxin type arsenate reductase
MTLSTVPPFLRLLAHDVRWELLAELSRSDRRVGELVALTARPQNLVSYHLGRLRDGGIVHERRSSADGRDVYYHLDLARLESLYHASGGALHPALACGPSTGPAAAAEHPARVLFLCTHNSARSQMAEALLSRAAGDRVRVAGAGSEPSAVHPLAIRVMAERGIDISRQRSKHMDELAARPWDVVVTVCDRVREVCPAFPAETRTIHWSVPDPAAAIGSEADRLAAFRATADEIARRVRFLAGELGAAAPTVGS